MEKINPKTQLGLLLFAIFITAFLNNPSAKVLVSYATITATAIFFDLFFLRIQKIPFFFPSAALVSALIITLVVNPNLSLYQLVFISFFAIFSKNFLRFQRHVFNPAGFGLLLGSLFSQDSISWWGVSFQQFRIQNLEFIIFFLILLSPALVSVVRMRRHRIIISFLLTYLLLNSVLISHFSLPISLLNPTLLFFALVMLPEPMTTPNRHFQQIMFGVTTALLSIFISLPFSNFEFRISNFETDPLITSLLLENLIFFKFR